MSGSTRRSASLARNVFLVVLYSIKRFAEARKYFQDLELDGLSSGGAIDALEEWLANPVIITSADPITYWTAQNGAGHPLARMALDFLSIPGEYFVLFD